MCKHLAFIILSLTVITIPTKLGSDFSRKTFGLVRGNLPLAVKVTGTLGNKTGKERYVNILFKNGQK